MGLSTNSSIVLSLFAFYIFLIVMLGLIGGSIVANRSIGDPENPSPLSFLSQIAFFFSGIGFALTNIPFWANTMLFLPLGVTLAYIGVSFFRGSS